ncbi:GntR family transcriptional regulator [Salibacterium aidingense]|uniref:GntR family transcriptional regulator n=1 Tax=Salibacterium aidingense TaxID=384933 RepID=UPI00047B75DD|nr:GntR family transcriptional regulator [Salibacterium aidingense]
MKKIGKFVSYTDQVYRELKSAIVSGDIQQGEFLQERSIAEQLGVSRTPVREAIKRLEFEDWVETLPWKGVVVKDIDRQDIIEVFQCRYANEGFVGERVASTITDENMAELKKIKSTMEELADESRQEFINEDRKFHMHLAQLTNNSLLIHFLDRLSDQMLRFGILAVKDKVRIKETLEEHQAIIDALETRSPEKTKEAIQRHIDNSQDVLLHQTKERE